MTARSSGELRSRVRDVDTARAAIQGFEYLIANGGRHADAILVRCKVQTKRNRRGRAGMNLSACSGFGRRRLVELAITPSPSRCSALPTIGYRRIARFTKDHGKFMATPHGRPAPAIILAVQQQNELTGTALLGGA